MAQNALWREDFGKKTCLHFSYKNMLLKYSKNMKRSPIPLTECSSSAVQKSCLATISHTNMKKKIFFFYMPLATDQWSWMVYNSHGLVPMHVLLKIGLLPLGPNPFRPMPFRPTPLGPIPNLANSHFVQCHLGQNPFRPMPFRPKPLSANAI